MAILVFVLALAAVACEGRPISEEPTFAERQTEILGILGQFITLTLARGDLTTVARMLRDLTDALARPEHEMAEWVRAEAK